MAKALGFVLAGLATVEIPLICAIPDDFECAWRSAAYDFGQKLLPRQGSFESLFQALELWNCSTWSMKYNLRKGRVARERQYESNPGWPVDAVMVSANDGGLSLQEACDLAVSQRSSKTVVLAEGTHHLDSSLVLGPEHSGLRIVGASPSGESKISGGVELHDLKWTQVGNTTWATYVDLAAHNLTEIEGLVINGTRRTVARYPNLPGGIESTCYYGCEAAGASAEWIPPIQFPNSSYYASAKVRNDSASGEFESYQIGIGGSCSIFEPAASYWCSENPQGGGAVRFAVPSGVQLPAGFGNSPYATHPRFHVYRPARWANWMFEAKLIGGNNYTFTRGGFQGARGDTAGGDFHVENVLEELDTEGEYYFDQSESVLYLFATEPPSSDASVVVPKLKVLFNATGTSNNPVMDVSLEKLSFVVSRHTYMEPHAVPSGGDWSLERQGALLVQGAHNFSIRNCAFDRIDTGNAVLVSGYNRNFSIIDCDFTSLAGTAIAVWGFTNETSTDPARPGITLQNAPAAGMDATDGEHPVGTIVRGCLASDIGLIVKQSAFLFQAKAQESVISGNVFFNAPRAGINLNDGMGGGDLISDNLIFNVVRETQDHGVINSWDRQPFLTEHGIYMKQHFAVRKITRNFLVNNYNPQECVDNDDGSAYYETYGNFLVYGARGLKNDFGGHSNYHHDNVYAFVDQALGVDNTLPGFEDHFVRNKVVLTKTSIGSLVCSGDAPTVLANNQYFTPNGTIVECGNELAIWQSQSPPRDVNSTVAPYPSTETVIQWARDLLQF